MNITTWRRRERAITGWGVRDFYDRALPEIYLFHFTTSRLELPRHGGSFSIKLALAGEEEYFVGRRTLRVRPGSFLLVNGGETYASRIRSATQSLSLFYPARDVAAARASLADDDRRALESADEGPDPAEVPQFSCRYSAQSRLHVTDLLSALGDRRHDAAEEAAAALLPALLGDLQGAAPPGSLDHVRKRTTRDELMGRIMRARDYLEDMHGRDCSLDRLAGIACLSKFHFLRLFRELFGVGPAAFARGLRLEEARRALARGDSERHVAMANGYANRHSLRRALGKAGHRRHAN